MARVRSGTADLLKTSRVDPDAMIIARKIYELRCDEEVM